MNPCDRTSLNLTITHIDLKTKPKYLLQIYVKNDSRRFIGGNIVLQIADADDTVTFSKIITIRDNLFTYQNVSINHHPNYESSEGEIANNLIVIGSPKAIKDCSDKTSNCWDDIATAKFRFKVRNFKSENIFKEDSKINLIWRCERSRRNYEYKVISTYHNSQDEQVAMSPVKPSQMLTTTWSSVKIR